MPLLKINRDPSPTTLRWFGLVQATVIGLIGGMAHWRFQSPVIAYGLWAFAAAFALIYYAVPRTRRSLYIGVIYATYPCGVALSYLTLFVIYFGLFTVVGIFLKMFGYDPLRGTFDRGAKTYWTPHAARRSASSYFRQF